MSSKIEGIKSTFSPQTYRGKEDLVLNLNKINVKLSLENSVKLVAGDMVKLTSGGLFGLPMATTVSTTQQRLDTETYGFIILNPIRNKYVDGDTCQIMLAGGAIEMVAGENILGGSEVYYDNRQQATYAAVSFYGLSYTSFTTITTGSLDLSIDGSIVSLSSLDFSSATSLNDVASVFNTALSTNGSCEVQGTSLVFKTKTIGVSGSISIASTSGNVYNVLYGNGIIENVSAGNDIIGGQGYIVKAPGSATNGLIKCGVALNDALIDQRVRVLIK